DFDNLIETYIIGLPDGYADMDSFNDELLEICQNHPAAKDYEQSMTMGQRIYNLHKGEDLKAYGPLVDFAYASFKRYCDARPANPNHPFLSQKPDNCFIDMWGSIIGQDGALQSHIHPQGWLSGVYYAHVPEAAETAKDQCEGWIEFGRPPKYPSEQGNVPFHRVQPVVGLMVFFPSYYFHQTIPFGSDETRFSIAFDFIAED
ncbi:MAG: putative 2OG-Fe(II) oxygenase, partial [Rhodospirillales bacterium]